MRGFCDPLHFNRGSTLVLDEGALMFHGSVYCRCHNWVVHASRVELIRVHDEENFFDFDKRDHGLTLA